MVRESENFHGCCRILLCLVAVELTDPEDRNRSRSFEFLNHNIGGIHKLCISHVEKRVFWGKNGTRKQIGNLVDSYVSEYLKSPHSTQYSLKAEADLLPVS